MELLKIEKKANFETSKEPKFLKYKIETYRRNYAFEVISTNITDGSVTNEEDIITFVDENEALRSGVKPENIKVSEDKMKENSFINLYRYERNIMDKINIKNAQRFDMGVIKMLNHELHNVEFMYSIESVKPELSVLCYGYVTHGYVDKNALKKIKKDGKLRLALEFLARTELYNELMSMV